MTNMEIVFHYSDVFHDHVPDIIEAVKHLNIHKAISIICELIQSRNYKTTVQVPFIGECEIPYETSIKNLLWPAETPDDLKTRNWYFDKKKHIYCEQYLLILLKYVIAYGDVETLQDSNYAVVEEDYKVILRLCLAIGEKQHIKHSSPIDQKTKNHFIYGNYHINRNSSAAAAFVRTYYLFKLCNDPNSFDADVRSEYKDYNKAFEDKYGFSIVQLINSLMWEMNGYSNPDLHIAYHSIWSDVEKKYNGTPCVELERKAISTLSRDIIRYKKWALETLDQEWDFSEFLLHPFLADGNGNYISISEYTIRNALFYNVYWMIRECYSQTDARAMSFYGRLYEKYLQEISFDASLNNKTVKYIAEFKFNKDRRSSDAYFQKDNRLIIVEMKGYMILIDSLIKNEKVEENYNKLFVKPVCQAYDCFKKIQQEGNFTNVSDIYIISVTLDSIRIC